jgi:hypothetical protein
MDPMFTTSVIPIHEPSVLPVTGHSRYSHIAQLIVQRNVRHELIALAAYLRAQRRGFGPGRELEDWLAAEAEVDTAITLGVYCG